MLDWMGESVFKCFNLFVGGSCQVSFWCVAEVIVPKLVFCIQHRIDQNIKPWNCVWKMPLYSSSYTDRDQDSTSKILTMNFDYYLNLDDPLIHVGSYWTIYGLDLVTWRRPRPKNLSDIIVLFMGRPLWIIDKTSHGKQAGGYWKSILHE